MLSDTGTRLEPPGFIWAKQEGPCLSGPPLLSAVGAWRLEQKVPPHNLHLSSSQPGTKTLFLSLPTPCPLFSLFLSPSSASSLLLSQATAWPTFYLSHSGPFDVNYIGLFHRSCVWLKISHLLNPQFVYKYIFQKQAMKLLVYEDESAFPCISSAYHSIWC